MLGIACGLPNLWVCAFAQNYPSKPIRIIAPTAAGGPNDLVTRPIAHKLTAALSTSVVLENRPGANGIIGIDFVAKSAADGYTLLAGSSGPMAIGPSVYAKIPYDVVKDFAPIGLFITTPKLLASHPSLPVKSIRELVALAQARPNELNFGSSGTGSAPHLAVELLKLAANIEMVHVPYKGMGPATVDLIGGQLQLAFPDLPVLVQHVKAGKLRALAVGTPQRSALMPEVPTMAESGYPQVEAYNWYALFAPAATPKEITARLSTELAAIVNAPETKALMQAQGADASSSTQAELGTLLQEEIGKWAKVVKAAGIKVQ